MKAVRNYFQEGTLPKQGTVCQTESSIFDNAMDSAKHLSSEDLVLLVEMLYYITMCQLTILYSFRLRLVSHLYSVDSPVCFLSSSIIIGFLISDFIRLCALSRLRRCHFRSDFQSRS